MFFSSVLANNLVRICSNCNLLLYNFACITYADDIDGLGEEFSLLNFTEVGVIGKRTPTTMSIIRFDNPK